MNITKKLEAFARITEQEAKSKHSQILKQIDAEVNSAVEESRQVALKDAEDKEKLAKIKASEEYKKEISLFEGKMKKEIILKREELKKSVFHSVRNRLESYLQTEEYYDKLKASILTKLESADISMIELMPRDYEKLCNEYPQYNAKLSSVGDDIVGGYKIYLTGGRKALDNTYKTKLTEAENDFNLSGQTAGSAI